MPMTKRADDPALQTQLRTRPEAADYLRVSHRHLWTITKEGLLPAIKLGRSVRYAQADLDAYVASCRTARKRSLTMASISINAKTGIREIYFAGPDGKRRKISLGRATKKQAETTKLRIEQLVQDQRLGTPHDAGLIEWIKELPDVMREKLVSAGLIEKRAGGITLGELIERFLSARTVKPATMASYKQCTDSLIEHLGEDTPIDRITAADADRWKVAIANSGRVREKEGPRSLSAATVAKRTNIAKAIFSKAKVWKLLTTSPFEHVKSGSQSNPGRAHYISKEDTQKLLDACPNIQWS